MPEGKEAMRRRHLHLRLITSISFILPKRDPTSEFANWEGAVMITTSSSLRRSLYAGGTPIIIKR
jgi:hypothetical protein